MTTKSEVLKRLRRKKIDAEFEIKQILEELDRAVKGIHVTGLAVTIRRSDDHPEVRWISEVELKMSFDPK